MRTRVLAVTVDPMVDPAVREAARLIARGDVVAFPTETVYGLGADAGNSEAVEEIYRAKGRPADNPLIVHISGAAELESIAKESTETALRLAEAFWPGPLTLVLPAQRPFRDSVCRGLSTIAVRCPDHLVALALIKRSGCPIAAPSANRSGYPSPTTAHHVLADLQGEIPLILDGGPCDVGIESTVLNLSRARPELLRPGGVSVERISALLGEEVELGGGAEERVRSPGLRYRHYRPHAPLFLIESNVAESLGRAVLDQIRQRVGRGRIGYLGHRRSIGSAPDVVMADPRRDDVEMARYLYSDLRGFDRKNVVAILVDQPDGEGLGSSIRDRLVRGAAGRLVSVGEKVAWDDQKDRWNE